MIMTIYYHLFYKIVTNTRLHTFNLNKNLQFIEYYACPSKRMYDTIF